MSDLSHAAATSKAWPFEEARRLSSATATARRPRATCSSRPAMAPPGCRTSAPSARSRAPRWSAAPSRLSRDIPTRLVCFSDDMDGMRKVPENVPNGEMLRANLQKPLTSVPDPFGEYESFGAHNNAMLRRFLDTFGFEYEFISATDFYRSGRFDAVLRRAAERYDALMQVMLASPARRAPADLLDLPADLAAVRPRPLRADQGGRRRRRHHHLRRRGRRRRPRSPSPAATSSCSGSPISARAGPRSTSTSKCTARTIRPTRRSTTRSARSSAAARPSTSPTSSSSTRTARRSRSRGATA